MPVSPGSRLDAYKIVRPLGSGGMGGVWLATEVRFGRMVALTVLHAAVDPEAVDITIQLAAALIAAHAPGIVHRDIEPENVSVSARRVRVLSASSSSADSLRQV
jgi:eukaryotic-like serine/threonine-protein kinase